MTDYNEEQQEKVVFALSKMGISLFSNDLQNQTGGGLSNLYFPGGLFVKNRTFLEKEIEENPDPSKIEVMENFDVFIDLVNYDDSKSNRSKKTNKTKKRTNNNHLQKN